MAAANIEDEYQIGERENYESRGQESNLGPSEYRVINTSPPPNIRDATKEHRAITTAVFEAVSNNARC